MDNKLYARAHGLNINDISPATERPEQREGERHQRKEEQLEAETTPSASQTAPRSALGGILSEVRSNDVWGGGADRHIYTEKIFVG